MTNTFAFKVFPVGETQTIQAHNRTLEVKRVDRHVYFAQLTDYRRHSRWGNLSEISEDVRFFQNAGQLPVAKVQWF